MIFAITTLLWKIDATDQTESGSMHVHLYTSLLDATDQTERGSMHVHHTIASSFCSKSDDLMIFPITKLFAWKIDATH
jgi:hypothetical protein